MTLTGIRAWVVLVVLILSLCVNAFFIGTMVTSRHMRDGGPGGGPAHEMAAIAGFERLLRGLPDDTRDHMLQAFGRHANEIRPAFRDLREARRESLEMLGGEPFAPEAVATALAGVRTQTVALQLLLHGIFIEVVADMPPDMRHDMAERWRQRQ